MQPPPIQRVHPQNLWSDAVIFNHTVYFVEVPESGSDIASQTLALLAQAETSLHAAGSSKHHLLMATIYLKHMSDRASFNTLWQEWLAPGCAPARVCVSAEMASPDYLLEIAFVAARREK